MSRGLDCRTEKGQYGKAAATSSNSMISSALRVDCSSVVSDGAGGNEPLKLEIEIRATAVFDLGIWEPKSERLQSKQPDISPGILERQPGDAKADTMGQASGRSDPPIAPFRSTLSRAFSTSTNRVRTLYVAPDGNVTCVKLSAKSGKDSRTKPRPTWSARLDHASQETSEGMRIAPSARRGTMTTAVTSAPGLDRKDDIGVSRRTLATSPETVRASVGYEERAQLSRRRTVCGGEESWSKRTCEASDTIFLRKACA